MKNLFNGLAALAVVATAFVATPKAEARIESPVYTCALKFQARGTDVQILVGYSKVSGHGTISCVDSIGNEQHMPVNVTFWSPAVFPRISIQPNVRVSGIASGIGVNFGGPSALLGRYLTVEAKAGVGPAGAGAAIALHGQNNAATINLSLMNVKGFGITAGATLVDITPGT